MRGNRTMLAFTCQRCGVSFAVTSRWLKNGTRKYCGRACMAIGRPKPPTTYHDRICEHCGQGYRMTQRQVSSGVRRYCTPACRLAATRVDPVAMYHRRVIKQDGCWGWRGKTDRRGYPFFELRRDGGIVTHRAHRLSYEIHIGPIPNGLSVLHHCDNPPCTRPDHLFSGTHRDNTDDKVAKGRQAVGERTGHAKLTADQVADILGRLAVRPRERGALSFIARTFSVSVATICDIDQGVSWKHIPRPTQDSLTLSGTEPFA